MKRQARNSFFLRLGIIGGIILAIIGIGYAFEQERLVFDILQAIGLLLIGITILVSIHELGHFLPAKWFGMRVDVFSIGFPPKLFGFKRGETEYQVGATPLGGYVKIAGMIDESFDQETIQREKDREASDQDWRRDKRLAPNPWEFRAKPVWQRLIVMVGGVTMNVILGILIFSTLKYIYGEQRTPMTEVKYGIYTLPGQASIGSMIGFETGDTLLTFNGDTLPYFEHYQDINRLLSDNAYYEVIRKGQVVRLDVRADIQDFLDDDDDSIATFMMQPDLPAEIMVRDSIEIETADEERKKVASRAHQAGLQTGDIILSLNDQSINRFSQILGFMQSRKANQQLNEVVHVKALRGADTLLVKIEPDERGYLGVWSRESEYIQKEKLDFSVGGAIVAGARTAFGAVSTNIQGFTNMAQGDASVSKSLKGPIAIAGFMLESYKRGGVKTFLALLGMLSMVLAFVNILPIPALDGGHVVFLLIEAITRREPSVKVRLVAQQIGMVLVLGLMVFVLLNDTIQQIN